MAAVMKSATRSKFPGLFPGIAWEYYIIDNPFKPVKKMLSDDTPVRETITQYGAQEVTRREALDYIEEHGLVPVLETKDGTIWDTPGGDFRKEFSLTTKARIEAINKNWD